MEEGATDLLARLEGAHVQSIVLLPGYVQVVLDVGILTCVCLPEIRVDDMAPRRGTPDWLAALWKLVGHEVKSATIRDDADLVITFDNGLLRLDLRLRSRETPEVAVLHLDTGEEMVM